MFLALIPTIAWAMGSIATSRVARAFGAAKANRWRMILAVAILGAWTLPQHGLPSWNATALWLLLSGIIGLGLGDIAMLIGYRHIGPRLCILILLCGAVPVAGVVEWLWQGVGIGHGDMLLMGLILTGVAIAVWPSARPRSTYGIVWIGLLFAILAAIGQGLATALSRIAYAASDQAIDGIAATWVRMCGGLACTLLAERVMHLTPGQPPVARAAAAMADDRCCQPPPVHHPWRWMVMATALGPVIGLSAYQWALIHHPGALIQAITACTPVVVIPLAWGIDGDRPSRRSIIGALLACAATMALLLA